MYKYKARLVKVIDADTLEIDIDLGFNMISRQRIRLLNVQANETRTTDIEEKKKGLVLKNKLIEFLNKYQFVYLKSHIEKYEFIEWETKFIQTFNRFVGEIFIDPDFKLSINEEINLWVKDINK